MKTSEGFLSTLGAPARRALENAGIKSLKKLSQYTEAEIFKLHGMGKSSIPKLKDALKSEGLKFKDGK
jgi:DNA-directed RNA polymerase alpha subunit